MNQDLSIITLVLHASFVVQLVMAGLMIVSLASWTVIFGKVFGLKRVRQGNDDFERALLAQEIRRQDFDARLRRQLAHTLAFFDCVRRGGGSVCR